MAADPEEEEPYQFIKLSIVKEKWEEDQFEQFSPVQRFRGYPWCVRLYNSLDNDDEINVAVVCDKSTESELWKCTAKFKEVFVTIVEETADRPYVVDLYVIEPHMRKHTFKSWDKSSHAYYVDKYGLHEGSKVEIYINNVDQHGKRRAFVTVPLGWTLRPTLNHFEPRDGILVIGEEETKIEVNKEFLASQSPYFDRLFYGNFMEKNMSEIPIGDVECEEFSNLIGLLYNQEAAMVTDENVLRVVELADRFELKIVEDRAVSFLLSSTSSVPLSQKLLIADRHNIQLMKDVLFNNRISNGHLKELSESEELEHMSPETISTIVEMCRSRFGPSFLLSMIH